VNESIRIYYIYVRRRERERKEREYTGIQNIDINFYILYILYSKEYRGN